MYASSIEQLRGKSLIYLSTAERSDFRFILFFGQDSKASVVVYYFSLLSRGLNLNTSPISEIEHRFTPLDKILILPAFVYLPLCAGTAVMAGALGALFTTAKLSLHTDLTSLLLNVRFCVPITQNKCIITQCYKFVNRYCNLSKKIPRNGLNVQSGGCLPRRRRLPLRWSPRLGQCSA